MSKAILVMDMPSSCDECPLFNSHYSDMTCRANGNGLTTHIRKTKDKIGVRCMSCRRKNRQ